MVRCCGSDSSKVTLLGFDISKSPAEYQRKSVRHIFELFIVSRPIKQVVAGFIVDFQVGDTHHKGDLCRLLRRCRSLLLFNRLEDVLNRPWDETTVFIPLRAARDGKCFARPRLHSHCSATALLQKCRSSQPGRKQRWCHCSLPTHCPNAQQVVLLPTRSSLTNQPHLWRPHPRPLPGQRQWAKPDRIESPTSLSSC